jgi:hypothetical protein
VWWVAGLAHHDKHRGIILAVDYTHANIAVSVKINRTKLGVLINIHNSHAICLLSDCTYLRRLYFGDSSYDLVTVPVTVLFATVTKEIPYRMGICTVLVTVVTELLICSHAQ